MKNLNHNNPNNNSSSHNGSNNSPSHNGSNNNLSHNNSSHNGSDNSPSHNNPSHNSFTVSASEEGNRLDHYLSKKTGMSRNQIQSLIKQSNILCNKKRPKASYHVLKGDEISLKNSESLKKDNFKLFFDDRIDLEIVFEDEDIIVINKPPGLVTHPGAGLEEQSVVHALFNRLPENIENPLRPGIVHRLDKDTQGLLVLAKNLESQENLLEQFKEKKVQRTYRTLCYGKFKNPSGSYKSFLARDPKNRKKYKSQQEGRFAITHFQVLKENEISFVELKLETGRTHQIRVHLSENHHPILNDTIYGHEKRIKEINDSNLKLFIRNLNQMPLIAVHLRFNHPKNSKTMEFSTPWLKEFIYENLSD